MQRKEGRKERTVLCWTESPRNRINLKSTVQYSTVHRDYNNSISLVRISYGWVADEKFSFWVTISRKMTASGLPRGHLRDDIQYNKNILINNESAITLSVISKPRFGQKGKDLCHRYRVQIIEKLKLSNFWCKFERKMTGE